MTLRNPEWYDLNEANNWPLADTATAIDDSGVRLPGNLIADINIWFPRAAGDFAFISAVSVGPAIATAIVLSTDTGYPPLASVSVAAPISPYRHYPLEPLYPGVGGWIVFGRGLESPTLHSHRFSTPAQSALLPQVARAYNPLPIQSIGKAGVRAALTGIVKLVGGSDIEIVKAYKEIDDIVHRVLLIQLKSESPEEQENVLTKYMGPCGNRPESGNCGEPAPIEFINSVGPDCCGTITMEFQGAAQVLVPDNDEHGVVIDVDFGMSEACALLDHLPDSLGYLPNHGDDSCLSLSSSEILGD